MITNSLSIKVSTSCCFLLPPSNTGKGLSQGSTNPPSAPTVPMGQQVIPPKAHKKVPK